MARKRRRIKYVVGGKDVEIPYIDGNAVRGYLRRLLMQDFLERLGYTVENLSLYHCLYSGGVLESSEEERSGVLDLALRREIRALIPPVSLLGVSFLNQAFSGKLIVGKVLPCCKELAQFLQKCDSVVYVSKWMRRYAELYTQYRHREMDGSFSGR